MGEPPLDRYLLGILRHVQALFRFICHDGVYDEQRADHEGLHRRILDRATA